MDRGFLKVFRKIQDNPLWNMKPFSWGHAWIDMLMIANHKDSSFMKRGVVIEVKRGQIGISTKGLADRWGWSRGKVDRFLKYLENEHQIEHQKTNITTVITLKNYEAYNETNTKTDTKRTPDEHQTNTSKELEELKEETPTTWPDKIRFAAQGKKAFIQNKAPWIDNDLFDFELEKAIAHYRTPGADPSLLILGWFQRVRKPKVEKQQQSQDEFWADFHKEFGDDGK